MSLVAMSGGARLRVKPGPIGGGGVANLVTFPNAGTERILGPLLTHEADNNPWTFYDSNLTSKATSAGAVYPTEIVSGTGNQTGTVAVTNGSATVTGTATAYTTQFWPGCWFYVRNSDDTGWEGVRYVLSVESDTSLTLTATYSGTTASGRAINRNVGNAYRDQLLGYTFYYDPALVQYMTYHRTGDVAYRTLARKAADVYYAGAFNEGVFTGDNGVAPRMAYMPGLILRALDGRPEMWDAIERYSDYQFNSWVYLRKDNATLYQGVRDGAFCTLFMGLLCALLPDSYRNTADTADVDGATKRTAHITRLAAVVTDYYERLQNADGGWYWSPDCASFPSYPDCIGTVNFHVGYLMEAMIQCHRFFESTGTHATQATACRNMILDCSTWLYSRVNQVETAKSGVYSRSLNYSTYPGDTGPWAAAATTSNRWIDARQNTTMICHVYGYCYKLTGDTAWLTKGDDLFSATYAYDSGPGHDDHISLMADLMLASWGYWSRGKEFHQAYRSSGRYLAWRVGA